MSDRKLAVLLYLLFTAVYAGTAGPRLLRPSSDTHFVYLADSWLHRRLDLGGPPPHGNDWAEVEQITLRDGTVLTGQRLRTQAMRFRTLKGEVRPISDSDIVKSSKKYYVSFPPGPALLMLPLVAAFGHRTNDVIFTVLLAGLIPALLFLLLRRLPGVLGLAPPAPSAAEETAPAGLSARAPELWLVLLFGLGSVLYFSSVIGQVWFTAHIVSLVLIELYLLCVFPRGRPSPRPLLAGLLLGLCYLTRPTMAPFGLLFVLELLRAHTPDRTYPLWPRPLDRLRAVPLRRLALPLLGFALPIAVLVAASMVHNYLRFGRPLEFGHTYLQTIQADNIQRFGLVNYHYLSRNLAAAFTLLPKILAGPPYVQISYHGLSLLVTTPALVYLLWPAPVPSDDPAAAQRRRELALALWVVVAPIALASFMYQNDGFVQFGFRFSLDYMVALVLLLWLGSQRALGTWRFRVLVLCGVAVNLFGAVTFGRMWQFYYNGFFPVQ
jgi:hypothetical protein